MEGQYQIIGSGGFAYVVGDNKKAYKIMELDNLSWISEYAIVKSLNHRNIIKFDDIEISSEYIYRKRGKKYTHGKLQHQQIKIHMKKYQKTLTDLKKFDDEKIIYVMERLIDAIAYTHQRGIIHRDVKEENILIDIDENGNIIDLALCDYGLAKFMNLMIEAEFSGNVTTISHRPPEMEKASFVGLNCIYDSRVDIWGLCMILSYMLTGKEFYNFVIHDDEIRRKYRNAREIARITESLNNEDGIFGFLLIYEEKFYSEYYKFLERYADKSLENYELYMEMIRIGITEYHRRATIMDYINLMPGGYKFVNIGYTNKYKFDTMEKNSISIALNNINRNLHRSDELMVKSYKYYKAIYGDVINPENAILCLILIEQILLENPFDPKCYIRYLKPYYDKITRKSIIYKLFDLLITATNPLKIIR